ncbi:MAG TPA: hypothetical protein VGV37_21370, partial [Aliidongia sp.]|uniref:beta strand repeat-containing protein n=1 Tax=Aliidongia sp. TaxID=1914230 RepID=UPI002DDD946A
SDAASSGTVTVELTDTSGTLSATGTGISGTAHDLLLTGTVAQVNADLATLSYLGSSSGSDTIDVNASDALGGHAVQTTIGVTVNNAHQPPVTTVPGAQTIEQGVATAISGASVADALTGGQTVTVTLTDTTGSLSATGTGVSGTAHDLVITGTVAQVNADLATLKDQSGTAGGDTITVNATDSLGSNAAQTTIGVTTNGPPVTTVPGAQLVEESAATAITGVSVADAASSGTVTLVLTDTTGNLSASGTGVSGSAHDLVITGSVAQVNADLATLTYTGTAPGGDTIDVNASDALGGHATQTTIGVTTNGPPVTTVPGAQTVEQGLARTISGVSVADTASSGNVTVELTDTTGTLSATGTGISGTAHDLVLTGTVAQVNADLATLKYQSSSVGGDTIDVNASDALGGHAVQTTIGVTTNGPPATTVPGAQTVEQGLARTISGVSVTDAASSGNVTVELTDTTGTLSATGTGVSGTAHDLVLTGTVAQVNADLATLKYQSGSAGSDTIDVNATDALGGHAAQTTIAVTTNGPPVTTVPGAQTVLTGTTTGISGVSVSDAASSGNVTVELTDTSGTLSATGTGISGTAHDLLLTGTVAQVNADLATLSYLGSSSGSDTIDVNASDTLGGHAVQTTIGVTVNNAHQPPVTTVPGAQTIEQGVATAISGVSVADALTGGQTVTVTLTDTTGSLSATGTGVSGSVHDLVITGTVAQVNADLATLKDQSGTAGGDTITVNATDSLGSNAAQTTIGVTTNGPPVTTVPGAQTVVAGAATGISGVSVADAASSGTVTLTLTDTSGTLSATGTGISGTAHDLVLTGTVAQVNADLATLRYLGSSAGSDTIDVNASDALGGHAVQTMIGVTVNNPAGSNFILTTGQDTFHGGAGNDTFTAVTRTLSANDVIDGGGGTNTLALVGGGTFALQTPTTLTNIQTITAQEGQTSYIGPTQTFASQVQTITLRDGLDATVNVTAAAVNAGNPKVPTITITGAHNAAVINLASGADVVTVGDARETVHGGSGNDTIIVNAATIGATIDGGTGNSTLDVTGGGTVTMGSSVTDIRTVALVAGATAYNFTANAISGLTITGGSGHDTFTGSSGGGDTFKNSASLFNGDTIKNLTALTDTLDFTDVNASTVATPTYHDNGNGTGLLTVTDGTHTASLTLFGQFSAAGFQTGSDGAGGTDVTYHPVSAPAVALALPHHA